MVDFSQFDDDFNAPKKAKGKFNSDNAALLDDGNYEMQVTGATTKEINGNPVVTITLLVTGETPFAGWFVEKPYFLVKKDGTKDSRKVQDLRDDLATMGFDTTGWKLGTHLPLALKAMVGCGVKVKKKAGGDHGQFANLYLNGRLDTDGKPAQFTIADLEAQAESPLEAPQGEPLPF